jgi:hypothetical protein
VIEGAKYFETVQVATDMTNMIIVIGVNLGHTPKKECWWS